LQTRVRPQRCEGKLRRAAVCNHKHATAGVVPEKCVKESCLERGVLLVSPVECSASYGSLAGSLPFDNCTAGHCAELTKRCAWIARLYYFSDRGLLQGDKAETRAAKVLPRYDNNPVLLRINDFGAWAHVCNFVCFTEVMCTRRHRPGIGFDGKRKSI
jgi:hypothetical protein